MGRIQTLWAVRFWSRGFSSREPETCPLRHAGGEAGGFHPNLRPSHDDDVTGGRLVRPPLALGTSECQRLPNAIGQAPSSGFFFGGGGRRSTGANANGGICRVGSKLSSEAMSGILSPTVARGAANASKPRNRRRSPAGRIRMPGRVARSRRPRWRACDRAVENQRAIVEGVDPPTERRRAAPAFKAAAPGGRAGIFY